MRLSRKSDYALRAIKHCASLPKGSYGSIRVIAEAESIPREFLAKILKELTNEGILTSYRGVSGGYALARDAKNISLLDVIEAVNGPLHVSLCTEPGWHQAASGGSCPLCAFWKAQENTVKKALTA